ncbi:uncharacterized protein LOC113037368 [Astatotilapia calliptera]|uniref:uncharacterized protein LOC113037368 n=1 Tax=Astatotilapia calliptera TaxID=8154 RepID=UPI000E40F6D8|nr:uncharacterized protein LOC113037368 [Astatotilapia calliptera]
MANLDPTTENLRIAHLNIRSLRNKIPDVHHILTRDKIHVLALTETQLDKNVKNFELTINNYKLYRKDRNNGNGKRAWGGVALYVRDQIPVKKDLPNLSDVEMIWIEIFLPHTKPVLIGCCYRPPKSTTEYLEKICRSIEQVLNPEKDIFLLGDFNIDWLSNSSLKEKITCFTHPMGLKQIVDYPTRFGKCIDHIYTNIHELCETPPEHPPPIITGCSDHNLVIANVRERKVPPQKIIQRSDTDFNEDNFIREIETVQWGEVEMELVPNMALSKFIHLFIPIAMNHARLMNLADNHHEPWWVENITPLIEKRDGEKQMGHTLNARIKHKKILKMFSDRKKQHFRPEHPLIKFLTEFRLPENVAVDNFLQSLSESVTQDIVSRLLTIAALHIPAPIQHILNILE